MRIVSAERVYTGEIAQPYASAIAIDGDRVAAVGDRDELLAGYAGAEHIEYAGASIIPGLIESHVHPAYTGFTDGWADCRPSACQSIADVQAALRTLHVAPGGWIVGWGYDDTLLAEDRHPTRDDLDVVSVDTPILLRHVSGHFAVGNGAALAASGIDLDSDPGAFPRMPDGRLSGLAWEVDAVHLLGAALPSPTRAELRRAITSALRTGRTRGITSVHDMGVGLLGGPDEVAAYDELAAAGELPTRVVGFLRGDLALGQLATEPGLFTARSTDPWWHVVGAKFWSDGSIQGLSAALRIPYACDHSLTGDLLQSEERLAEMVAGVSAAGGQVAVHANGDAAVAATIRALSAAPNPAGKRHRIEHCQVTEPTDLATMVEAGIAASFFINHVYYWGDRHRDRFLGPERAARIDPLAEADVRGILFGLHSDCPITPMAPLETMRHAALRLTSDGRELGGDQRISLERALQAMTIDSARLVGTADETGSLRPGKYADYVVLDGTLEQATAADAGPPIAVVVAGDR